MRCQAKSGETGGGMRRIECMTVKRDGNVVVSKQNRARA